VVVLLMNECFNMSYIDSIVDKAVYLLGLTVECEKRGDHGNAYRYECCLFELIGQMSEEELEQYRTKVN
jgi:hypothetical protein